MHANSVYFFSDFFFGAKKKTIIARRKSQLYHPMQTREPKVIKHTEKQWHTSILSSWWWLKSDAFRFVVCSIDYSSITIVVNAIQQVQYNWFRVYKAWHNIETHVNKKKRGAIISTCKHSFLGLFWPEWSS